MFPELCRETRKPDNPVDPHSQRMMEIEVREFIIRI
jgi:hypothetical protein